MKKITGILMLVAIFAMTLSLTAFAAGSNTITLTADKTAVAAGESVIVTVDLSGALADIASVELTIDFDDTKFSAVTTGRAPWCFDAEWYNTMKTEDPSNLGYISAPSVALKDGDIKVLYVSQSGYYIDDASPLYAGGTTTAAKIKFTALTDVTSIDASCFSLVEGATGCVVTDTNAVPHTVSLVQIPSNDPDPVKVPGEAVTAKTTLETAEATFDNVAIYEIKWPVSANAVYGVSVNNVDKDLAPGVAITGSGNVEYVLAFFNIADANVLEVIPYTYQ